MQLAYFMAIVTFMHLSCEEQSEASPDIFGEMKYLPQDCKDKLKEQIQNKCSGHIFQPLLVKVSECTFRCGDEHDNGFTQAKTGQIYNMKDGTPCGHSRVCINGKCVDTCKMDFV
uniref:Putative ixostatin n=1 Tax=Ixodes ricinus TaxID=34613 RepID=A0A0K8RCX6_IXORI